MSDAILTLNAGSSSIKFALFVARTQARILGGQIERVGAAPHFVARDSAGTELGSRQLPAESTADHEEVLADLLTWIDSHLGDAKLIAAGHRVVHGGREFAAPLAVTPEVLAALEALVPLAPLHQPHNLAAIRAVAAARPELSQIACFDTAFHRTQPPVSRHFALPRALTEAGIERYGFHGLSYEYIAAALRDRAPGLARGRVVAAHLGAGASLCAMRDGQSVETTMGFTALDGLPMATRCGALDPGGVLYLWQSRGLSAAEVEDLLYHKSGLLGVSGLSADLRTLAASADRHAAEAIDLFCHRVARETAALAVALGGLDAIVFTAGIGEHSAQVRASVCSRLGWLGVALDPAANARNAERMDAPGSAVAVWAIPTDEESMIARHSWDILTAA